MSVLTIQDLTFFHEGEAAPVFQKVNLELDTRWHLGLIGRNGRGKTTFLKLLMGEYEYAGKIECSEAFEYFPVTVPPTGETALTVARRLIAPFDEWEEKMLALTAEATPAALEAYGEIEEQYAAADGYVINELIEADASRLGIHPEVLQNPFETLSGGEQVKLMLAALFLRKHCFLLMDEPTDHLDTEGRALVAKWLQDKSGYILVSHDRAFLDACVDHVLSINRADIELQKGDYSSWRHNRTLQDNCELAENQKMEANIRRLKAAAQQTKSWSDKIEKSKKNTGTASYDGGSASVDRGYIGHQAARMMQRSKSIERRQTKEIEEKQSLLKNIETVEPLLVKTLPTKQKRLLAAENLSACFGQRCLFEGLSFAVTAGDRLAIQGPNGSGKSTLLKLLVGELAPTQGTVRKQEGLVASSIPQDTSFLQGNLQQYAKKLGLDQSLFLSILRKLDFERDAFTRPMEKYSMGEKKKVCLAVSLARPAHLFLWDEPLNYVDVLSREQIEDAILTCKPTLVFVEHDAVFTEKVATSCIQL